MVLNRALLFVAVAIGAGCLQKKPAVRLSERTPLAVGVVLDHELDPRVDEAPPALRKRLADVLSERNFEVKEVPLSATGFDGIRGSSRRFERLSEVAGDAPVVLLVETKAVFFSQLNGRFRWVVSVRITAGERRGRSVVESAQFDESAILEYDFEKEPEAVARAAGVIADRAGGLVDRLMATFAPPPAQGRDGSPPSGALLPDDGALYFVMVDRFANGDPANDGEIDPRDPAAFHGGDLQGVLDHVEDLHALGVRTVWLSPVFKMRTQKFYEWGAYHGYWVEDLLRMEPRFGDVALLKKLSAALHARGMRLMLDVVLNHVAMDAPLVKEAPHFFHGKGGIEDWNDADQLLTRDVHGLPDLAQEREDVYRHLLDASLRWARDVDPDGFRLDAVKHVPLSFWSRYNEELRARAGPGFVLLGELLDGDPALLARTSREGKFDALFDFPLAFALVDVFCKDRPPARIGATFALDRLYDDPFSLVTLVDNHDLPRVLTACGGDVERVKGALAVQLTARGTPSLTYGTEVGLAGAKEPENRGDMRFDLDPPLKAFVSRLLRLRRELPSLRHGIPMAVALDDGLFAYARVSPGEATVVAINRGTVAHRIPLGGELGRARATDLETGAVLSPGYLDVPSKGVRLARLSPKESGGFKALADRARSEWRGTSAKRVVEVSARGAPLSDGDGLFVTGSSEELGHWQPRRGLGPLDTAGTRALELPVGGVHEYKLVVQRSGGSAEWERGENRALFVPEGSGPLKVVLAWNER
jgi:glycosidase